MDTPKYTTEERITLVRNLLQGHKDDAAKYRTRAEAYEKEGKGQLSESFHRDADREDELVIFAEYLLLMLFPK